MCIGRLSEIRLFSIYSNSTHLVVFEDLLWQANTPVFMAGVFLLAGMSSASGGALPFYGRAGHLLCSHQLPVCVTGEWSFLQGTQAYQLSITQKKRAPCLGRRYEKMLLTHSFLFRCVSQPPPLRGTSFHRKEGEPCPCIAFPYCHFELKREIFFVCGQ